MPKLNKGRGLTALALLLLIAPNAFADIDLLKVSWQLSKRAQGQAARAEDITALPLQANGRLAGRLKANLSLLNRGREAEGVLLRYSLVGRICASGHPQAAAWAVPFMIEEKRVPKAAANKHFNVTLDPTELFRLYLRRLERSGYELLEIKLQVMIEPRRGETGRIDFMESVLPMSTGAAK